MSTTTWPSIRREPELLGQRAQARRTLDEHLLLVVEVARNVAGKVRPGGTLLFMGGLIQRQVRS